MLLRAYRTDDLAAVHAINDAEVPAVGAETPEALAHIAAQSVVAHVAEVDAAVAGFCLVLAPGADYGSKNYAWFSERYDDFIYLDRVAISPAHQRRGIGRALYAEVERLVPERRPLATAFALEVNLRPRNDTSLAFHARLGFAEVGRRETDYDTLVSMMVKPLR
jgi:predicted GNAT superfamily acetyltransferase